jgi:hypothetical protein
VKRSLEVCPICGRIVAVTQHFTVMAHSDKAGTLCPFSGEPLSGEIQDGEAA